MTVEVLFETLVPALVAEAPAAMAQQLVLQQTALQRVADVAIILIAACILAVLVFALIALNELRLAKRKLVAFVDALRLDLTPTIGHINDASRNVSFVTTTLANRIGDFDDTLDFTNRKLRASVNSLYGRAREFDALLRVAQGELEGVFISAASIIGGLKRGAGAAIGLGGRRWRRSMRNRKQDGRFAYEDLAGDDEDDFDDSRDYDDDDDDYADVEVAELDDADDADDEDGGMDDEDEWVDDDSELPRPSIRRGPRRGRASR
jgi:hypothetical protein